ncbi:hypothetical protein DYB34_014039 [Aphanomyces astaci]|nr:hypothetical protein DYB34_014039 [Aphanomyces astaci]
MTNILAFLTVFATVASATAYRNDNHELDAATKACLKARRTFNGEKRQFCAAGQDFLGWLCYDKCPSNMARVGVDCHSICPPEFTDMGLTCLKKGTYGRGVGYSWKSGDGVSNTTGMFQRCEKDNGQGNCEIHEAVVYPKCLPGYTPVGCCICQPLLPDCESFGLLPRGGFNPSVGLSCAKKIVIGKPNRPKCHADDDLVGDRCYPKCSKPSYNLGEPV